MTFSSLLLFFFCSPSLPTPMELDRSRVFNYWLRESGSCSLRCAVVEFKRSPRAFLDTLNTWPIANIGDALETEGYDSTLPSGCKVLVPPRYYSTVLAHLSGTNIALFNSLKRRHVIVAWEFESILMSEMLKIPTQSNGEMPSFGCTTGSDPKRKVSAMANMLTSKSP